MSIGSLMFKIPLFVIVPVRLTDCQTSLFAPSVTSLNSHSEQRQYNDPCQESPFCSQPIAKFSIIPLHLILAQEFPPLINYFMTHIYTVKSVNDSYIQHIGREEGVRTLVPLYGTTRFPVGANNPLWHLSILSIFTGHLHEPSCSAIMTFSYS